MNRGFLQSLPVQQIIAGKPTCWNIDSMRQTSQPTIFFSAPSNSFPPYTAASSLNSNIPYSNEEQDQLPETRRQLLMGGPVNEEAMVSMGQLQSKKLENWDGILFSQAPDANMVNMNHENSDDSYSYRRENQEVQAGTKRTWSKKMSSVSSPNSCVTSFKSNLLGFANTTEEKTPPPAYLSSECNSSTAAGGAGKKPRVQPTSSTSKTTTFKVRKEKLGDRITALHQLVSPFGKTDTASVLLEAIGYIRFLQSQIEALSLPYLGSGSARMRFQQSDSHEEPKKDLRSRGLYLVPISYTLEVGSDNGADYWSPALAGGEFC